MEHNLEPAARLVDFLLGRTLDSGLSRDALAKYEVRSRRVHLLLYNGTLNTLRPKHVSRAVRMEEWMDACFNMRRRWSNPLSECTKSESQSVDLFRICQSVDPSANHMYVFPQDIDLTRSTPFRCFNPGEQTCLIGYCYNTVALHEYYKPKISETIQSLESKRSKIPTRTHGPL